MPQQKKKKNIYLTLFLSTFNLSAFTFGGGFVIVPLMKKKFVDELHWIDEEEMLNLAAIAQSSPGAVAVNAAILVGYRTAGVLGALTAIFGTILPPFIILSVVSVFYSFFRDNPVVAAVLKGMQAGVSAVIADVVVHMFSGITREEKVIPLVIAAAAFAATYVFKVNVMYIILACAAFGMVRALIEKKRKGGAGR